MSQIALVENANTSNITLVYDGNYRLTLPNGDSIQPVATGWVGDVYRLCSVNFDVPIPSYIAAVNIGANAGLNYTNSDILTVSGGTVTGNVGQIQVFGIGANGRVTTLIVANAGYYTAEPPTPNSPTGGTGTGLSVDLVTSQYEITTSTYVYNANTNAVTETNTYKTPVIDNSVSIEKQRQEDLNGDPNNLALKDKLKTATRAQIDAWLLTNVTNLAEARNVLGAIVKFLANKFANDT